MISLLFAGLWPMLWHFGIGGMIVAGCVALAILMPAWVPFPRKDLIWVAAIVSAALFFEAVGIHTEKARRDAQEQVIEKRVDDAVKNSEDAVNQGKKDPFDDPRL